MAAFEINHTRIAGVSRCAPLSEQPITTKPSAYLGYIPDSTPSSPQSHYQQQNHGNVQFNPLYNKPISLSEQIPAYIRENTNRDYRIPENQAPTITQPLNNEQSYYTSLQPNSVQAELQSDLPHGNTDLNLLNDHVPIPYQKQNNLLSSKIPLPLSLSTALPEPPKILRSVESKSMEQIDLSEPDILPPSPSQTLYSSIDPKFQEKQINKLASQIEELRTRVQELTSQNQRLAENLNQMLPKAQFNDSEEIRNTIETKTAAPAGNFSATIESSFENTREP